MPRGGKLCAPGRPPIIPQKRPLSPFGPVLVSRAVLQSQDIVVPSARRRTGAWRGWRPTYSVHSLLSRHRRGSSHSGRVRQVSYSWPGVSLSCIAVTLIMRIRLVMGQWAPRAELRAQAASWARKVPVRLRPLLPRDHAQVGVLDLQSCTMAVEPLLSRNRAATLVGQGPNPRLTSSTPPGCAGR